MISGPGKVPPARTVLDRGVIGEDNDDGESNDINSLPRVAVGCDDLVDNVEVCNGSYSSVDTRYKISR